MIAPIGSGMSGLPGASAEEEIAYQVIQRIMPQLRALLAEVRNLSEAWNTPANGIPAKIAAAHAAEATLAGYDPHAWDEWGQAFMAIMGMIASPQTIIYSTEEPETAQKSAAEIVATRYVRA